MCGTYAVPSESWRLSLAFESAWRAWDVRSKSQFRQVDTDLRNGSDGYLVLTRATEKKSVMCLFWGRSGPEYVIYARESFAGDNFNADEVASLVDGGLPAEAWQSLARNIIAALGNAS